MKENNWGLGIALLLLTGVVLFIFKDKIFGEKKQADDKKPGGNNAGANNVTEPAQVPLPPANNPMQTAANASNQGQPLDPYQEPAKTAVKNYIKSLMTSGEAENYRRENSIGGNLFGGITNAAAKAKLREYALAFGGIDDYDLPLIPDFIEPAFQQQLKELEKFTGDFPTNWKSFGKKKEPYINKLIQLCDFSKYGFALLPSTYKEIHDRIFNRAGIYGECKSGVFHDVANVLSPAYSALASGDKENNCKIEHIRQMTADLNRIAKNFVAANDKFSKDVQNFAIVQMSKAGWNFVGFN